MRLPSAKSIDFLINAYDANGNRVQATVNGVTTTASYTLDDQLEVYGNNTYLYNVDGYLASKITLEGTTHYSYKTLGELRSVMLPDGTAIEYLHNANNQRVTKKVNGVITEKYLWEDLTTLLAVYDGSNNLKMRFNYADGRMPYKMSYEGQRYYLAYDQVGTLKAVSTEDGTIVKQIDYDTFGNVFLDSNSTLKVPFGFAGGLYDTDTKLTRFAYRDYDAYTGKWTAKDPIGFDGGDTNLYGYVLGDPVNFVDPSGLELDLMLDLRSQPTATQGIAGRIWIERNTSVSNPYPRITQPSRIGRVHVPGTSAIDIEAWPFVWKDPIINPLDPNQANIQVGVCIDVFTW